MIDLYDAAVQAQMSLPGGAWDVGSFLDNAKSTAKDWGSGLLMLVGVVMLVWGGVKLAMKLMANQQNQQQQASYGTILLLLVCGGALFGSGFGIINTVSSGGQETIEDLGGGAVVLQVPDVPTSDAGPLSIR